MIYDFIIISLQVMREETICKICFNLLNDIDYHLKEAQEKTDDITNKFLDKEKDPLSYKPHQLIALSSNSPRPSEIQSSNASLGSRDDDDRDTTISSSRRRNTRHRNNKRSSNSNKEGITSDSIEDKDDSNVFSKRYQSRLEEETELVVGAGETGEDNDEDVGFNQDR